MLVLFSFLVFFFLKAICLVYVRCVDLKRTPALTAYVWDGLCFALRFILSLVLARKYALQRMHGIERRVIASLLEDIDESKTLESFPCTINRCSGHLCPYFQHVVGYCEPLLPATSVGNEHEGMP